MAAQTHVASQPGTVVCVQLIGAVHVTAITATHKGRMSTIRDSPARPGGKAAVCIGCKCFTVFMLCAVRAADDCRGVSAHKGTATRLLQHATV